jgi:hypothetical protein
LAILFATDSWETCRWMLEGFREQQHAGRLELVIAAPAAAGLSRDDPDARGFPQVRVVAVESIAPIGRAEARAWPAATAPFIVFAETCARPLPGFVDAMIAACRSGRWAVVGPKMTNANPGSATSWAAMHINYGPWLDASTAAARTDTPGHNSAYRRDALASLHGEVEPLLESLTALQRELGRRGYAIGFEPQARVAMLNVSLPGWFVIDQFSKGCQFAAMRCRRWTAFRRVAYAGGAPLIPLVRAWRVTALLRRLGRSHELRHGARAGMLLAGLVASGAGEMVGYVFGLVVRGHSERALHRFQYVRPADRPPGDTSAGA